MRSTTVIGSGPLGAAFGAALLLTTGIAEAQSSSDEGLFFIGKPARVESGKTVEAAIVIGDDLVVAGNVDGVAAAIGGDLHVIPGARVDGAALAIGGDLRIDEGAVVMGPRVIVAGGDFSQVMGEVSSQVRFEQTASPMWAGPIVRLAQVLALFVLAVFLVLLAPRYVQSVRQTLSRQPGVALLVGLVVMLGIVPLCVLLALSLVGIPLIPVAIIGLVAACTLGLTALAAVLGFALPFIKDPSNLFGAMALGMLLLALSAAIPLVGALVLFFASAAGAGAALLSRFGARPPRPPATPAQNMRTGSPHADPPVQAQV